MRKSRIFLWILCLVWSLSWQTVDAVTYVYDEAGRIAQVRYDDGTVHTYEYDVNGNVVTVLSGDGPSEQEHRITPKESSYPKDKVWTVRLSHAVDLQSAQRAISVLDMHDQKVQGIGITLGQDSKTILILPPSSGYDLGNYVLHISKDLRSEQGNSLRRKTVMDFVIR